MFALFMEKMRPEINSTILNIGVTSDDRYKEANYFEKMYPHKNRIVCVGVEDGSHLETNYPGIKFIKIDPQKPLPFKDREFDIAFSNAVIEHAGNSDQQRFFIDEMVRISRSFYLTTPNRWFPIELHTAIPLLHFLPKKTYRKLLNLMGETYWSKEQNLNLLSKEELNALFPKQTKVIIENIQIFGMVTNLIAIGKSE